MVNDTVQLRGLERYFAVTPKAISIICHTIEVEVKGKAIFQDITSIQEAFLHVINHHPRMRGKLQNENKDYILEVLPQLTLDDIQKRGIVNKLDPLVVDWKKHVGTKCLVPMPRGDGVLFRLDLLQVTPTKTRIFHFSDHCVSDGYSGCIILNAFLSNLVSPPKSPVVSRALLPGIFVMTQTLKKKLTGFMLPFGSSFLASDVKKFKSVLPIPEYLPFKVQETITIPTLYSDFLNGEPGNLAMALKRCKEEGVTLHGAVLAALLVSLEKSKNPNNTDLENSTGTGRCELSIDYNMRKRKVNPFLGDDVGFYVGIRTLESLKKKGYSMNEMFWDTARKLKRETDRNLTRGFPLEEVFTDSLTDSRQSSLKRLQMLSFLGDFNFSNMGKFPFPLVHENSESGIQIEEFHLYNSCGGIAPATVFFLTTVKSISYSISSGVLPATAKPFFENLVHLIENCGSIKKEETLMQVCKRLL